MPAQPDQHEQVKRLILAQAAARAAVTAQLVALATSAVRGFGGWYDTAAITAWSRTLAANAEVLLKNLARRTDAYLAQVSSLLSGRRTRPVGAVPVTTLRLGVSHAGAYARAADAYRWQQAQLDRYATTVAPETPSPPTLVSAVEAAVQRVSDVADLDAQLVTTRQSQAFYERQKTLTGYRRVIHPERSKGGTCGLCIAASDRLYGPKELLPIHGHCECTTLPVYDHADAGSEINKRDLADLYGDAGSTGRADLKRTRYRIDQHGELGPTLVPADAKTRTARQAQRDANTVRRPQTLEERRARVARVLEEQAAALTRVQRLAGDKPAVWGDYATQLESRVADLQRQLAA